jgi:3-phosphoshikimate 1-carboxyvinyltransferase
MSGAIRISPSPGPVVGTFEVPRSKSIANRLMMLRAFAGQKQEEPTAADPDDMHVLHRALQQQADGTVEVGMAGTAFRFMLPYLAMQRGREALLSGAHRMLQRPIGPLVSTLRSLGAHISYQGQEGYPPVLVRGGALAGGEATVDTGTSSQFASALLLAAPFMAHGLRLHLAGDTVSLPYIRMTVALLQASGAQVRTEGRTVQVAPGPIAVPEGLDEPDHSSASYAYLVAALRPGSRLFIPALQPKSLQGDAEARTLFAALGVHTAYTAHGAVLTGTGAVAPCPTFDLTHCPDLAPALLAACAGLGAQATFTGVAHLAHKESDRMRAMATELQKLGVRLHEERGTWRISGRAMPTHATLNPHNDHRLAMSLAPLCLSMGAGIALSHPEVAGKSFPRYWEVLRRIKLCMAEGGS